SNSSSPITSITPSSPSPSTSPLAPSYSAPPPPAPVVIPGGTSDLAKALLPPSLRPSQLAQPDPVPLSLEPLPSQPPKPSQPSSSSQEGAANTAPAQTQVQYFVVVEYSSERSLQQARKIVYDAYVKNFPQGKRIQMGAFRSESEAKAFIEKLKQQGIAASVYRVN
ncbi:MAG: SPOR domain-containing protein, partial [Moorea sp. SIO2B7]|nr:SPOR domain-containing protein [Moorena sp. SIO2B7]